MRFESKIYFIGLSTANFSHEKAQKGTKELEELPTAHGFWLPNFCSLLCFFVAKN